MAGRARYLLALSRPRFWLYLAGPVLVGVAYAATDLGDLFAPAAFVLFAYFLVPANVFLYGVNDAFDVDADAANPKKEDREARWSGDPVAVGAVALSGVLGVVAFAVSPRVAWPWLAGFFALGVAYSAPPARLKTRPPLDSASNGLYLLPGAAAYAAVAGVHPPGLAVVGGWLWTMGMHTFSAVPDVDPDRAAGLRTTATVLGEARTLAYCAVVWTLAAVAFGLLDLRLGLLLGLYPPLAAGVYASDVPTDRAYWWFPAVNAAVGMVLTLGGLWRAAYG